MECKHYLPLFLQDYREFDALCGEYDKYLALIEENVFFPLSVLDYDNLTETGVKYLERIFNVPYRNKPMEDRVNLLKLLAYTEENYNEYTFQEVLNIIFHGAVDFEVVKGHYGLNILINSVITKEGGTDLLRYIITRYVPMDLSLISTNNVKLQNDGYTLYSADRLNIFETIEIGGTFNG